MQNRKSQKALFRIVLIGLFAAMCYVVLFFKIPIPSPVGNPFLHMGNMLVILAALLFSGPVGGIAGSLGMGLFDLTQGYATYAPKTLVLKFGIGIVVGAVFSLGRKDGAKSPVRWVFAAAAAFLTGGCALLVAAIRLGNEIRIEGIEKSLVINPVLYVFMLILGLLLLGGGIFSKRFPVRLQYAGLAAVCGIVFNVIGEFLFGAATLMIAGSAVIPALIASAVSLPATLINGTFSIVAALVLFVPLEKAVKKAGLIIR